MCIFSASAISSLPELGMRDGDQPLGPLPVDLPLDVELAVLRHDPVEIGAGGGDHGALQQGGTDAGLELAGFLSMKEEEQQMKLLPPLDRYAPMTKSRWPPAPEM